MLVNWNGNGMKVIPVGKTERIVRLVPGYNQVNDADWGIARNLVLVQIGDGKIEEEWANAEKDGTKHRDAAFSIPGEDAKQPTVVRIPANLKDVNRIQATKIVNNTYSPDVLSAFLSTESREDVRLAIIAQKEKVETPKRTA